LIAPLSVGDGATIGAGSAINKNVSDGALSLTRAPQKEIQDWDKQIKRNANRK
jgi:bifunctional UDP-N-acetylglucosamine pyrophosphorylase/glucosamine-1-phosphate N-acetyltransferase